MWKSKYGNAPPWKSNEVPQEDIDMIIKSKSLTDKEKKNFFAMLATKYKNVEEKTIDKLLSENNQNQEPDDENKETDARSVATTVMTGSLCEYFFIFL